MTATFVEKANAAPIDAGGWRNIIRLATRLTNQLGPRVQERGSKGLTDTDGIS